MKHNDPLDSPLGKESDYRSSYAPELLFPIPRSEGRTLLGIGESLPFQGVDLWTAYELSWLDNRGKPQVALAEFVVPCDSTFIIESKSLKLYLNSLNQTKYDNLQTVKGIIESDLSRAADAHVLVRLEPVSANIPSISQTESYACIDDLDIEIEQYQPNIRLLTADSERQVSEQLVSHLLKSNCPVTGQPDWASLFIDYSGPQIDKEGLLRYLVSYREHMGFHEQCVEQIFVNIMERCEPQKLTLNARYLRRGGLDINPIRSTETVYELIGRQIRQ